MAYQNCATSGCEDDLPEVEISEDCPGDVQASEIEEVYMMKSGGSAFVDWSDPAEWATRLSQSLSVSGNEIRKLIGIGEKPAASPVIVNSAKKMKKRIDANHVINFEIDNVTDKNYDWATKLQCGSYKRIWYNTRGEKLHGGNTGILVYVDVQLVYGKGDEVTKILLSMSWNSKQDPERIASPI